MIEDTKMEWNQNRRIYRIKFCGMKMNAPTKWLALLTSIIAVLTLTVFVVRVAEYLNLSECKTYPEDYCEKTEPSDNDPILHKFSTIFTQR